MNALIRRFNGGSEIQRYDPIDVLYDINPEIASLAYANRDKWLTSDIIPTINNFRKLQSNEQIALLKGIVQKCAIDADERKNEVVCTTLERIKQLESGTTQFAETQKTAREQLRSQSFLDAQKLKYETNLAIARAYTNRQVQISEQQAKALIKEAQAMRDAIIAASSAMANAEIHKSDNQTAVTVLRINADIEIVERKCTSREILAKLNVFKTMFTKTIEKDIAEFQSRSQTEQEALISLRHTFQNGCMALQNGKNSINGTISLNNNDIKIHLEIE